MERVPIVKIGTTLFVSIQIDLQDESVMRLQEDLADELAATGARGVLIDITAVEIVDSFIGRMLTMIGSISRLFDAETVLVGMRPAVAITLTELGLSLRGVRTALNAEKGLELLSGKSLWRSCRSGPATTWCASGSRYGWWPNEAAFPWSIRRSLLPRPVSWPVTH
jgi:rsbT antagonist protein RsbS